MTMQRCALIAAAVLALATQLSGCFPLVAAGAAGVALVATDRRSAGAQLDDAAIEGKISGEADRRFGDQAHISATSYNGIVLFTGEVPDEAARDAMVALARGTDRVRGVQNELQVMPPAALTERTNDAYLTSVVKTRFLEASDKFSATHVKVVTDRKVVYLLGIVKRAEADAAAAIAASTKGVVRVVKVFEYLD
jgi:osmotically-inducible protein OsmY